MGERTDVGSCTELDVCVVARLRGRKKKREAKIKKDPAVAGRVDLLLPSGKGDLAKWLLNLLQYNGTVTVMTDRNSYIVL